MRAFLAFAAVALLIVVWLPSRGASRGRAEPLAVAEPPPGSQATEPAAAPVEEERGRGGEEEDAGGHACRLTVVSRADGSPVAGATVLDEDDRPQAVTGADGVAAFQGVARRWYAEAPGFFPDSADLDPDGTGWVALAPAAAVTGRVLDARTRMPVAGARIVLWADDPDLGGDGATADEAGRFEVSGALWQPFVLVAKAEGYTPAEVEGAVRGPLHGIEVCLKAGATLEGTVWGWDGGVAAKARVYLMAGREAVPRIQVTTDEEGAYRIAGVPLGIEVVPWCIAERRYHGDAVTFLEAGEVRRRDLRPPATVTLMVTAVGPEGEPLELSDVDLDPPADPEQGSRHFGWTFRVPAGRYRIKARADRWVAQEREITVSTDAREEIVFGGGLAVEGRVVSTDGAVVRTNVDWWDAVSSGYVSVDAEGRFRIDGLKAGPVQLSVDPWEHARKTVDGVVPGGPPVLIVVEPAARITGRLVGAERRDDLDLSIFSEFRSGGCDRLEDDGTFEFVVPDLGAPVLVTFRRRSCEAPVVIALPGLSSREVRDLGEIRFDEGRSVRGRIVGPDKAPVVGALVTVVEPWATQSTPRHSRSDDSGRFCLLRQPKSPIWVRVDANGHPSHVFRVEGGEAELRLSVPGVAQGPGKATLVPDGPSEWAENTGLDVPAGADGRFEARLQPGPYHGWAVVAGQGRELVPFVVREGETTQVELKPR